MNDPKAILIFIGVVVLIFVLQAVVYFVGFTRGSNKGYAQGYDRGHAHGLEESVQRDNSLSVKTYNLVTLKAGYDEMFNERTDKRVIVAELNDSIFTQLKPYIRKAKCDDFDLGGERYKAEVTIIDQRGEVYAPFLTERND